MTKEQKILINITRFIGRQRAQNIVCRDRIERKLALKRISHARANTSGTSETGDVKITTLIDGPDSLISNSVD